MSFTETPEQRETRHHSTLYELAELGLDLARDAFAVAKEQLIDPAPPPEKQVDRSKTFAALSREIRGVIALERRLDRRPQPQPDRHRRPRPIRPSAEPTRVETAPLPPSAKAAPATPAPTSPIDPGTRPNPIRPRPPAPPTPADLPLIPPIGRPAPYPVPS